ncbi:MAG TPA: SDR family NAD(P)-dependent oxidoreductase [Candidatus Binatia bacterium]|jgi:NAD(P)-dependent dehydrogenase (short-subunit alcohol dehydrogenase family)|nr:SDR family NAD(P)-dependent oxidoreductase [Candidatus Binatia bacterium]
MESRSEIVLVTGAAGNLGRAVASAFAGRGAALVLLDQRRDLLEKTFGAEDDRRVFAPTDLLDQSQMNATAAAAVARFGRIDVLCNLAGGFRMGEAVHETSDDTWTFLFDINTRTLLHTVRAVVPHMLAGGGGRIVNVGSAAALHGVGQMGAYTAAKSAVIRLTEAMAAELRERNVNVNCVLPTVIDTPVNRAAMPDADPSRWVSPDDLANVILFLASPAARAIHGAALPVSGLS